MIKDVPLRRGTPTAPPTKMKTMKSPATKQNKTMRTQERKQNGGKTVANINLGTSGPIDNSSGSLLFRPGIQHTPFGADLGNYKEKPLPGAEVADFRDKRMYFYTDGTPLSTKLCHEQIVTCAVMRRRLGYPASEIRLSSSAGYCNGTGMKIPAAEAMLLELAPYVWKYGDGPIGSTPIGFLSGAPFRRAVDILNAIHRQDSTQGSDNVLDKGSVAMEMLWQLRKTEEELVDYRELIEDFGRCLPKWGRVSRCNVDFIFSNFERDMNEQKRLHNQGRAVA